ncbi:MAG TPA: ATP-binding protein [Casimicrobiaceae bacterium]|nr:ATP-binding protein [Casimicrobiaceae bacterium]
MNAEIIVEERSQVAQARREAVALAKRLAFEPNVTDTLGLAVTETATNLVKHGGGGTVLISPLTAKSVGGIEIIAIDRGPGIANVAASMRDGHSTAGSPGLGLGSLSRLATNLDIYSRKDSGTVLRFEVWNGAKALPAMPVCFGGVCIAKRGETMCGDAWTIRAVHDTQRMLVVDGLGHGSGAATAAQLAVRIAQQETNATPIALLESIHDALRSTRGAAGAVASVMPGTASGVFAGVGNIRAFVRAGTTERSLVSHNGTLGHQVRKLQSFEFMFPPRALLIMHSDGIATHWSLDAYPGLQSHHPATIAATIFRDHARSRDDATIVVLRNDTTAG